MKPWLVNGSILHTLALYLGLVFSVCISPLALSQDAESESGPKVRIETSMGNFDIVLFPDNAPQTVKNFLRYVDEGFYDNTLFHRVIKRFVVQGGGYNKDFVKKQTHAPVVNESRNRLYNEKGMVAMARGDDPDSATSQFYVNLRMNGRLDHRFGSPGYTVFGKVIKGMEVVNDISLQETGDRNKLSDVPVEDIVLISARRI